MDNNTDLFQQHKPKGGIFTVSDEEKERRISICRDKCQHYAKAANLLELCTGCGCVLNWKVWLKAGNCPADKW
jgi:hypothetical protein